MKTGRPSKNTTLALLFAAISVGMVGATFASAPLYRLFCQVTGYAGTPRISTEAPARASTQTMTVRFNADVNRDMPWRFRPARNRVTVNLGETMVATYVAENLSDEPITGTATFNVTPLKAASYFNKIQCFCFTEQRLEPGQRVEMPVSFFVDSDIAEDPNTAEVKAITLSYTFFPIREEAGP